MYNIYSLQIFQPQIIHLNPQICEKVGILTYNTEKLSKLYLQNILHPFSKVLLSQAHIVLQPPRQAIKPPGRSNRCMERQHFL